jgi:hypothetical protein
MRSLRDGGVLAYLVEGRVVQLAIFDSAMPVEAARAFVEGLPAAAELAEWL